MPENVIPSNATIIIRHSLTWLLAVLLTTQPALLPYTYGATSKEAPAPTTTPAPPPAQSSNVDLTIASLNTTNVTTDSQTLAISGNLEVTIQNLGSVATNTQFTVLAFEDRNLNGKYDSGTDLQFGATNVTQNIAAAAIATVNVALSGTVLFKGNLIYAFVDSGNAIQETNENNNYRASFTTLPGSYSKTTIIPYAAIGYKYKVVNWGDMAGFEQFSFDDSSFSTGNAGFGPNCGDLPNNTDWPVNTDLLVRKKFNLSGFTKNLKVSVAIDNDIQVYINGVDISGGMALSGGCAYRGRFEFSVPDNVLRQGENLIAARGHDYGLATYLDLEVNGEIASNISAPDLTASYIRKDDYKFPTSTDLTARIGNGNNGTGPGPNLIKNGSFEDSDASINLGGNYLIIGAGDTRITNWTVIGTGSIDYVGGLWQTAAGQRSVDLDGDIGAYGGMEQTISTIPGHTYQIQFSLAGNPDAGPIIKPIRVSAAGQSATFSFDITGKTRQNMGYERKTWSFVANSNATTLRFESLTNTTTSTPGWGPVLDNVEAHDISSGSGPTVSVPPGVNIAFYLGDPAAGGKLLGTTQTSKSLSPGEYEDVKITWNNPPAGIHPIYVVADDDGTGKGSVTEGDETNNKANASIPLGFGPFALVDDLTAQFKDSLVNLKWSAVQGATNYNVYRRSGNQSAQLLKRGQTVTAFDDNTVTNGTTYYYTVRWVDANGKESGDGTEISATPTTQANRTGHDVPPTITSTPTTKAIADSPFAPTVKALDPDTTDKLTYSLVSAPTGMTINATTGKLQFTPNLSNAGYNNVTVRVEDSRQRFATQTSRLFVEVPNQPPVANAGEDQNVMITTGATLNGRVGDDGLPFGGGLSSKWTKVSGPGTVTFENANAAQTKATFSTKGTYVLRLIANDSNASDSDDVTISVVREFASRVYTLNADFGEGNLSNVDTRIPDQLQLGERAQPFNFIWVAVSSKGTVVKINTDTGQIVGEYWTSPDGQPKNPSRTTVDLNGNVWLTNRDGNSVTRIGLVENGQCKDRNNNGKIDTSIGQNDIKAWTNANGADTNGGVTTAQDECICNYVRVSASGTRHVSVNKENDVWVSGYGAGNHGVFDLLDGVTGIIKRTEGPVGYGGYGGLIDKNGVIWSARRLLRWDTAKPLSGPNGGTWQGYEHESYGLGIDSQGNVWNSEYGSYTRKFAPDGTLLGTFSHGAGQSQGVAVSKNGDVWVAHSLNNGATTVGHLRNDGTFIGNVTVGSGPTGVAVDANGKIWVTNYHSANVARIDPNKGPIGADGITQIGEVDLTTVNLGGNPYNYSDMTGSTLSGAPHSGTWSVVWDSKIASAEWGKMTWNATVCGDGALTVTAASSLDGTTFGTAQNVTRGDDLTVADGRYLKITVLFKRASTGESPILYNLSVGTDGYAPPVSINATPQVDAGADQLIALPRTAKLRGSVCDDSLPIGNPVTITWAKVSGPGNVTIASPSAIETTASFDQIGTYVLRLTANDGEKSAADDITITVENNNRPPVISSQPVLKGYAARPYVYQVIASDPNAGDTLTYTLPIVPTGMTINSSTGLIQWTPTAAQQGNHNVKVVVTDSFGATAEQAFTLVVTDPGPNNPPTITSTPWKGAAIGTPYNYQAVASDPDPGDVMTWSLDTAPSGMSINSTTGLVQWIPLSSQVGSHNVTVRVRDLGGLSATQSFTITVVATVQPIFVDLTTPMPGATIQKITDLNGVVSDPNGSSGPPTTWKVELRVEGSNTYKTIGSGTGAVNDAKIATIDPTNLPNGLIYIKLSAIKGLDYQSIEYPYSIAGDLKLGNFEIAFTDLTIPVAGIPISITRSYNSLYTATKGEFGQGWRLALAGNVVDTALESPGGDETFTGGTRVYVTRPDGRRVGFTFAPYKFHPLFAIYKPYFKPDPGVTDTLEVPDANLWGGPGGYFEDIFDIYNPRLYTLKTKEGIKYEIDEFDGLKKVTDLNGNTLTVRADGLFHSSGVNVSFERDAQGRITKITEPTIPGKTPGTLQYAYDSLGNLLSFTDQSGAVTKYSYIYAQFPNYLSKIEDALGRAVARNVVDSEGRLIGICDANGDPATLSGCTKLEPVAAANKQTIFNARGFKTELFLDERGNVLRERKWLDATNFLDTVRTYDANNNLLTEIDPAGNTKTYTYDNRGNRLTLKDAIGNTTTYTYNSCNLVATVTDALGSVATNTYDEKCNLRFIKNTLNNTTEYRYNEQGQPTEIIDPLGGRQVLSYDSVGYLVSKREALGQVTHNTYDALGRLISDQDPLGNITKHTYNALGLLTSTTNALNQTEQHEYDAVGNKIKDINQLGHVTTYAHDANRNLISTTTNRTTATGGVELLVTAYQYDQLNQLIKTTYPDGSSAEISYNSLGQKSSSKDQLGRETKFEYDGAGRLIRTTYPDLTKVEATYDGEGRRLTSKDQAGRITSYLYNALGRLTRTTFPDGATINSTYDELGRVNATTDARGNTTTYSYDPNCGCSERRTRIVDALGKTTIFTYDANGNQLTRTDANNHTTKYEYDLTNRRTKTVYPDGGANTISYDVLGRATTKTDQAGKTTQYEFDASGRLVKVTDALSQVTRFAYDEVNNLISRTDANGHSTNYEYDKLGRRIRRTLPLGMSEKHLYDSAGNLISKTDFNSKTTTYNYDVMNRLLSRVPDASLNQSDIRYTYTSTGKRASMIDATGTTTYAYDNRDRLLSKITSHGTLTYTYDSASNLLSVNSSNPNGVSSNYSYDALNRMLTVADNRLPVGANTTSYTYDNISNLNGVTLPNGVQSTYAYNSLNRLTSLTVSKSTTLASYIYTLGSAGNRLSVTDLNGRKAEYSYDAVYRLTSEKISGDLISFNNGLITYSYDATGNRTSRNSSVAPIPTQAFTYDANDRLMTDSYDANGNMTSSNGKPFGYDFEDRLTSANVATPQEVRFIYDGDGNRVGKIASSITTWYLVDTNNPTGYAQVVEEISNGNVQRVYVYGQTRISQRRRVGSTWTVSYYSYDGHGNVKALLNADGAITDSYEYDAFGNLLSQTGITPNDFLYTGEQRDANVGFYFLRARYYNESIGRFITMDLDAGDLDLKDFIYEPKTLHKYLYAEADPINKIDPSGYNAIAGYATSSRIATINIIPVALLGACISNLLLSSSVVLATGGTPTVSASSPCAAGRRPCPPCPSCPPPPPPRIDRVPPSAPHHPCTGDHMHIYYYEPGQDPKTCKCFCRLKQEEPVTCL